VFAIWVAINWALHVPPVLSPLKGIRGKLHNERWVPVDHEVCTLVARLRFLATLPPHSEGRASVCPL